MLRGTASNCGRLFVPNASGETDLGRREGGIPMSAITLARLRGRPGGAVRAVTVSVLAFVTMLTLGIGTAAGAPPPPFTLSPTGTLALSAAVGGDGYGLVTVTTGTKKVVIVSPATLAGGLPFSDTQAGSCWQNYGSRGLAVPAKSNCTIQVGFHPTAAGTVTDVMTVYACKKWHVDPTRGWIVCDVPDVGRSVNLSGTGQVPDLTISSIALTPGVQPNSYTVTIVNIGPVTADVSGVGLSGFYDPNPGTWPGHTGACGTTINPNTTIAANGQLSVLVPCTYGGQTGDAYLNVKVDDTDKVLEASEANNVGSVALPTAPPDLVVTHIEILGADANNPTNYDVTVQNIGAGPVDIESTIRVQGYFSVLPSYDSTDRAACGQSFGADPGFVLLPGDTVLVSIACTVRPVAGENYMLAVVDSLGAVAESNEANNVGWQVLPEVDLTVVGIAIDSFSPSFQYTVTIHLTEIAPSPQVPIEMAGVRVIGSYSSDGVNPSNPACDVLQSSSLIVAPGGTFSLHVTCPDLPAPSDRFLIVNIDSFNVIAEYDELNNTEPLAFPA